MKMITRFSIAFANHTDVYTRAYVAVLMVIFTYISISKPQVISNRYYKEFVKCDKNNYSGLRSSRSSVQK